MLPSRRFAVAGGTGGIGQHVVEGLLELKAKSSSPDSFHIIVLSRSSRPPITLEGTSQSAQVIPVDYSDTAAIASILNEHKIDTVISTLWGGEDALTTAQCNLLNAALTVPTFRRFAPSEFTMDSEANTVSWFAYKRPVLKLLREAKTQRGTDKFEWTKFATGVFMNYLVYGSPKEGSERAHGHLGRFPLIVDLSKAEGEVPGDGNMVLRFTLAEDVGKFVAAATQLETWPERCSMSGSLISINEIVRLAEQILGKKVKVTYYPREEVVKRLNEAVAAGKDEFDFERYLWDGYLAWIDVLEPNDNVLNELTDVKPVSVEDFLKTWWG